MKNVPSYVIRQSTKEDAPELFDILLHHGSSFKHDHLDIGRSFVLQISGANECMAVEKDGEVTGFFLVTDIFDGLHCQGHFLCIPKHWAGWLKEGVIEKWIDMVWVRYNVVKLKAAVKLSQVERPTSKIGDNNKPINRLTPLGKTLKRLKFFRLWMEVDEYRVNGKLCNGISYELRRQFWHRERKRNGA